MYGQRENPYGDPYRRRPPMDPYGRGGYGGYGFVCFGDCMDMSTYVLPGLVVLSLFIGLILFIAGFSAPYWITNGDANVGLWKSCDGMADETCKNLVGEDSFDLQWFTATQAMTTISLMFLILAFAMLAYWLCTETRFFFIKALIISLLFMTFIFLIVSIGIFGGNYDDEMTFDNYDLDWAFYLVLVSSILILLGGCFLLCVSSYGSYPDFTFRDRFGFGAGRGFGGPGPGGPGPNPAYGAYGAGRDVYGTGLPYTARY